MHRHQRVVISASLGTRLVAQKVQDAVAGAPVAAATARSVATARPLRVEPALGVCQLTLRSHKASVMGGLQVLVDRHQDRANDYRGQGKRTDDTAETKV